MKTTILLLPFFFLTINAPVKAQVRTMEQTQKLREANPPKALWQAVKTAAYWYWIFH